MKVIKLHLKQLATVLSILILMQGCTVYKSASVTLNEAYSSNSKVKVTAFENKILKYKRIRHENNQYYGIQKIQGQEVKSLMENTRIKKIQLKDKLLSIIIPMAIPLLPIIIFGITHDSKKGEGGYFGLYNK